MRRLRSGQTSAQAIVEFALITVIVGFAATAGTLLLGPSVKAHLMEIDTTWPEVRLGGLNVIVNPTDHPTGIPTSTSIYTATATIQPTMTTAPTFTATPTATLMPTFTSTPTFTPFPSATPTAPLTYQQWCVASGYTWRSFLQKCYDGWTYVPPP